MDPIIQRAVDAAGSASELARQLGITRAAIPQWKQIPVRRVLEIERITGISRHELRPDIYGPAPQARGPGHD